MTRRPKGLLALTSMGAISLIWFAAMGGPAQGSIAAGPNGKIAFSVGDPESEVDATKCLTINPDGTGAVQIGGVGVHCPDNPGDRGWSPDSRKLLLQIANAAGQGRPATAKPDGSDFTPLDHYPNLHQTFSCGFWSPDGARFLCRSAENDDPAKDGLYTLRSSDGGGLTRVTATPRGQADGPVGYSPDDSQILFERVGSDNLGSLFTINPDGSGLRRLSPPSLRVGASDCCGAAADWSPDGSQVAFAAFWKGNVGRARRTAMFVVNADGTGLRRITPFGLGARNGATWSPDGRLIAFNLRFIDSPGPQVWVVHPDGTGLKELTRPTSGYSSYEPVWSPDSTRLLFERVNADGESLWIAKADGGGLTKLTDVPGDTNYAWGSAPVS